MKYSILIFFLLFTSCSMNRMIQREKEQILSNVPESEPGTVTKEQLQSLPEPVRKWIESTGIVGRKEIRHGWIRQSAEIQMKPGQEQWFSAEAEQIFTTIPPAFLWTIKMKMNPLISIKGRDKFADGKGEMRIRMNSLINVVNDGGEKIDEGTIQRYLGEIVWYPSAALSPFITWEAIDDYTAKATMTFNGTEGSGTFFFNEEGDFIKFSAMRYKGNTPDAKRYEWIISVQDYAVMDGVRVPVKMTATWKLDEGDWTWLKLIIQEIKYNEI